MTIEERNIAIGMVRAGASFKEVGKVFNRDPSAIRKLHAKFNYTGTTQDRPRSGHPQILSRH
ncbi:hypothetical protein BM1_10592 [Bipolaris maydis]|nr:hypothetical protein BM1_10592 [Bipolaris maydis]